MRDGARAVWVAVCAALLLPVCGFAPDPAQSVGADFIVTAAPTYEPLAALRGQERFKKGAQLLLVHEGQAEPLVPGFAATRTPTSPSVRRRYCLRASRRQAMRGRCGS